jgi:poly-beta-1,6-N-acetyl-D-glucosamine synthase
MTPLPTYALVTPARNEAANLRRLADAVERQTVLPAVWLIVDNGSGDGTPALLRELEERHAWVRSIWVAPDPGVARGAPIVRAFNAGLAALGERPDVVVKLDADVSFEPDFFARLIGRFAEDPRLGMASGDCYEHDGKRWRVDNGARDHVRGATRAYRRECLAAVLPLEERMGWDGIDEVKAGLRGWRTTRFADLPFYHHRPLGEREGARLQKWIRQGDMHHYMGYRMSYLLLRALYRARRDPLALAIVWGYLEAVLERRPRCPDREVLAHLRAQQSVRHLPLRMREVFRPSAGTPAA